MSRALYKLIFRVLGVRDLYEKVVQQDRLDEIRPKIRGDLEKLLAQINCNNPYFEGRFTDFLEVNKDVDDETFFKAYAQLPALSKQDYAEAGQSVMSRELASVDPKSKELKVRGKPIEALKRLRRGDYLMPMATGGSTSLPLIVRMTKYHMFATLFTFFKCWYRMGWRPGDRMLVFYPRNTYNIDDMVKFNRFSRLIGFRYHLFDHINEETVRGLVDDLNRYRPTLLLVFPSPLNMIAHTIQKYNLPLDYQPPLINVSGETFFDCQRKNIESVFTDSKVEDSYGSVELGEIAHETNGGLEIFANAAYVETEPNDAGQPEMVVTRLDVSDFPFVRYRMRDIADVEFVRDENGQERFLITKIEGKDSNFIMSDQGERFYPSFWNDFVNQLNIQLEDAVIEIKVYERQQKELEIQYILSDSAWCQKVEDLSLTLLNERMSSTMRYNIKFVDFIDHDYRRKYRVIERIGDVEFAGGMVGDNEKSETVQQIEAQAT
ncbi:MAG: hypothetical protein MK106_06240 [Mariniblastus sp.]|nr:hypothetical protein [Mariniblastus sp.]